MAKTVQAGKCLTIVSNLKKDNGTMDGEDHNTVAVVPFPDTATIKDQASFDQWVTDTFALHKAIASGADVELTLKGGKKKTFTPLSYSNDDQAKAIASGKAFVPRDILAEQSPEFRILAEMLVDSFKLKHQNKGGAILRREWVPSKGGKKGRQRTGIGEVDESLFE